MNDAARTNGMGALGIVAVVVGLTACGAGAGLEGGKTSAPTEDAGDGGLPSWMDPGDATAPEGSDPDGPTAELPAPVGQVITVRAGEGIDLVAGLLMAPGSFANSDVFATHNGDGLRLASGGETATEPRAVNWFIGADGGPILFTDLDAVPELLPAPDQNAALPIAELRCGFVMETSDGGWVKGWIRAIGWDDFNESWRADVEFEPIDLPTWKA